jgi:hypothetical protein
VLHLAPTHAAVMGVPKALPYAEAVDRTHADAFPVQECG